MICQKCFPVKDDKNFCILFDSQFSATLGENIIGHEKEVS